ncbi:MAG: hypothetical protein H6574_22025 [Lewinellaceae bacterium]|nr:hypothetical protein [Saprospiraceae bacterium]MCB9316935.1 hypothetical protein [Lewinellaceae bacterium]MCB9333742.1 hypothetical protein [Lewinellaceae bacterium]
MRKLYLPTAAGLKCVLSSGSTLLVGGDNPSTSTSVVAFGSVGILEH